MQRSPACLPRPIMHDRNHCCAQMMYTYTRTAYTRRGGAAEMRHAPCSIVPHEFYARLPVTDHRYAPGVTKTKGIHAQTPLRVEIQTEVGGKKGRLFFQNLPLFLSFRFFLFLSDFSFILFLFSHHVLSCHHRYFSHELSLFPHARGTIDTGSKYFPASKNR